MIDELKEDQPQDWPMFRLLSPHLQALISDSGTRIDDHHLETLARAAGRAAAADGQMQSANLGIDLLTPALDLVEHRPLNKSPAVLVAWQQLAVLKADLGLFKDAEEIYRGILDVQTQDWPTDDPAVLATRHNRAGSIGAQPGRQAEAERELRQVLQDERRVLGADHPNTLATRCQLAVLWCRQERWDEAERELRALLVDQQRLLGSNSRHALSTRHNLAQIAWQRGRDKEADDAVSELLAEETSLLGPDHHITVTTGHRDGTFLNISLLSTPDLREELAADLVDKALEHSKANRAAEVAKAYQKLLDRFGRDPSPGLQRLTAAAAFRYAITLRELGRLDEALATADGAVAAYRQLTRSSPDDFADAEAAAEQLAAAIQLQLGLDLFQTAVTHRKADRPGRAAEAYQELLGRVGRDRSPDMQRLTADARFNQAIILADLGRLDEALPPADSAVAAYHQLARTCPDEFADAATAAARLATEIRLKLAQSLHSQAADLHASRHHEDAMTAAEAAEAAYRTHDSTPSGCQDGLAAVHQLLLRIKLGLASELLDRARGYDDEQLDQARTAYSELVERFSVETDPRLREITAIALFDLGGVLYQLNQNATSLEKYQQFIDDHAGSPARELQLLTAEARINRVMILDWMGQIGETEAAAADRQAEAEAVAAETAFRKLAREGSKDAEAGLDKTLRFLEGLKSKRDH